MLVFSVWWVDLEFHRLLLKMIKTQKESRAYAPPCLFQVKTLTHYWHVCVWRVKCYITQRSEKSKRLEAEMEREGEFFPLQKWNWKRWGKWENILFSLTVMKSCVEIILAGKPSRHAVELCNVQVCACEGKTSRSNEKNKACEYEKTVIFIQHLHTYFKYTYLHILYNEYISCV